jgi:hypothetical protein
VTAQSSLAVMVTSPFAMVLTSAFLFREQHKKRRKFGSQTTPTSSYVDVVCFFQTKHGCE